MRGFHFILSEQRLRAEKQLPATKEPQDKLQRIKDLILDKQELNRNQPSPRLSNQPINLPHNGRTLRLPPTSQPHPLIQTNLLPLKAEQNIFPPKLLPKTKRPKNRSNQIFQYFE